MVKHLRIAFVSLVLFACAGQKTGDSDRIVLGVVHGLLNLSDTYVISADGTGKASGKLPWGLGGQAEWSPDGQWIVFSTLYDGGPADSDIYLMRSDGSQRKRVTENPRGSFDPTWSPDGTHIAYYAYDSQTGIYILNSECFLDKDKQDCDPAPNYIIQGSRPDWSPDGKRIVYQSVDDSILVTNSDATGEPVNFTPAMITCLNPKWSPDGTKIAFSCFQQDHHDIYVVNADGSGLINLTNGVGSNTRPSWSLDGSKIAFVSKRDGLGKMIGLDDTNRSNAIFLMNADGTDVIRLSLRDDETVLWYAWLPPATLSINP